MAKVIDVLLLFALPASGKSEVRRYLANLTPEQCHDDFHLGHTVQLDDYPYVHMMRRISQELRKLGADGVFFDSDDKPMKESLDWGTLIELLNEDYGDMVDRHEPSPDSAAEWLFDRFDVARVKVGAEPALGKLPSDTRAKLADALETEAADLLRDKIAEIPESLEGKTVVLEAARGGPDGATLPLPSPLGYRYSIARLRDEILERSSILYVWVTPEESRRKNVARTDPNDPGSILHHGVPHDVMMGDYGCDDMEWLLEHSERPGTIRIEARGRAYDIPVARFDNRTDKTTFVREDRSEWKKEDVEALHAGLAGALEELARAVRA